MYDLLRADDKNKGFTKLKNDMEKFKNQKNQKFRAIAAGGDGTVKNKQHTKTTHIKKILK